MTAFSPLAKCIHKTLNNGRNAVGIPYFPDTGWHASYFLNYSRFGQKVAVIKAHQELSTDKYSNEIHIRDFMKIGTDLTNRDTHRLHKHTIVLTLGLTLAIAQW
eukprot:1136-Heterococcus_DN1.PRE.2